MANVDEQSINKYGAVVLCGGESRRMGFPKALLPVGQELMLQRVVRLLGEVTPLNQITVVRSPGQQLPPLPEDVLVAEDRRQGHGPLEGLAAGFKTLVGRVEAVFATSCDVPRLQPVLVKHLFAMLDDYDAAVVKQDHLYHPLTAVYRVSVVNTLNALLDEGHSKLMELFAHITTLEVPAQQLQEVDPDLGSLANVNSPADYLQALRELGFTAPPEIVEQLN